MDFYAEAIMDHFRNPRNYGRIVGASRKVRLENQVCGDMIEVCLQFEGKSLQKVRWEGEGCVLCMAGASMVTESIKNLKSIKRIKSIKGEDLLEMMGLGELTPARTRCALLGWEAIRNALGGE